MPEAPTILLSGHFRSRRVHIVVRLPQEGRACKIPRFLRHDVPCPSPLHSSAPASPAASPIRQGKVRDIYDVGDRAAHRRHRPHLGVRLRARLRHSRQGASVLTQISAFWFERTAGIVPTTSSRTDVGRLSGAVPRRMRTCCAAARCSSRKTEPLPDRVRGARVPVRVGLEGLPADGHGLRHAAAAGLARIRPAARADLHAGHQGRERTRHQHQRAEHAGTLVGHDARRPRSNA